MKTVVRSLLWIVATRELMSLQSVRAPTQGPNKDEGPDPRTVQCKCVCLCSFCCFRGACFLVGVVPKTGHDLAGLPRYCSLLRPTVHIKPS